MCIWSPNLAKWSWIVCVASFISVRVEKRKVPSSTYSKSSIWNALPFVVFGFGCRVSLPYWQVELFRPGKYCKFVTGEFHMKGLNCCLHDVKKENGCHIVALLYACFVVYRGSQFCFVPSIIVAFFIFLEFSDVG